MADDPGDDTAFARWLALLTPDHRLHQEIGPLLLARLDSGPSLPAEQVLQELAREFGFDLEARRPAGSDQSDRGPDL